MGMVPMEYVRTDLANGHHLYRCRGEGCHLLESRKGGVLHCDSEAWEDPSTNILLFGKIRRDSPEWKAYYRMRQAIERVFKSLKESRRLERHCVRGQSHIALHSLMAVLAFQATALTRVRNGLLEWMRWQVRKIA